MAHIYERVVQLISKDPSRRSDRDIESLIPWFQNMSGLFKSQKMDVVKDIVRNCEFWSVPVDNLIIKQGDIGDCGSVSIYINQTLEEQGNVQNPNEQKAGKRKAMHRGNKTRSDSKPTPVHSRSKNLAQTGHTTPEGAEKIGAGDTNEGGERPPEPSSIDPPKPPEENVEQPLGSTRESRSNSWTTTTYSQREASFFQDTNKEDQQNENESASSGEEELQTDSTGKLDRRIFGVHIRELGPGKSFGELALVQTNLVRSATVIADQVTGLIVVDRDLYNRSLKAAQQQEFAEKKQFVNNFPLFSHWTPRQRNVMAMSLTRVRYQYGNSIVRQGDNVRGLIFITSGRAVVSIDPIQHIDQYPNMCSQDDVRFAKEVRIGKRSRTSFPGSPLYWPSDLRKPGPNNARRRDSYAAAEKEVNKKSIQLCAIGPNDYVGDISILLQLPTYAATATCLEPLEALELDLNNFERQVFKKSHSTYVAMREISELKLGARVDRIREEQIYSPVFEAMLCKFQDLNTTPAMKAALRRKQAEEDDLITSLFTPSWHSYREKQRLFLRRRQREKRLQEMRMEQMAHAASLSMQLRIQSTNMLSEFQKNDEAENQFDHKDASLRNNSIPAFTLQPLTQHGRQHSHSRRYDEYYLPSNSSTAPPVHMRQGGSDTSSLWSHNMADVKPHFRSWNENNQDTRKVTGLAEGHQRLRPQQVGDLSSLGLETVQ